jgi:hypothetical protein
MDWMADSRDVSGFQPKFAGNSANSWSKSSIRLRMLGAWQAKAVCR